MKGSKEQELRAIRRALLRWFDKNRRAFPWRETFESPDPYLILFTEIMLQRTKAEQVVPVYSEFVERYPTFAHLSNASESDVVSLFARLGLRWRARNVVRLIRVLEEKFDGEIPRDIADLKKLPAVGDYVANAVMCYAFGERTAPVDSNVVRVVSRLFGLTTTGDSARRSKQVLQVANSLIHKERAVDLNLALLDIAAQVCKPKPLCQVCPLQLFCQYYQVRKTSQASVVRES